jgi:carbamoyltransferase
MGMAPFGTPRYADKVMKLLRLDDDGGFHLNMEYFTFPYSTEKMYSGKFIELLGSPRDPNLNFFTPSTGYPSYFGRKPENYDQLGGLNQHYADVAASIQAVTENVMVKMALEAHRATGLKNLCMAGGVALNSVGNGKIVKEAPFEHIYIQPAAGDDGGALGAALHGYHTVLEQPRKLVMEHAYWGEQHCTAEVEKFLRESRIPYERLEDEEELLSRVVNALTEGKVVGWSQGRFEWGPRALGNRSILADPRRTDMKDIVNTKIKFREPYRPFAPSVLVERASEFFEIDEPEQRFPARFMLYVVKVKPDKQHLLPATTHVDGTARLQTVHRDVSPRYYRLIERFGEATGVPVLLNTSFNLRGEPIVNTPREAFQTFSKSDMDLLVLENCLVYKS